MESDPVDPHQAAAFAVGKKGERPALRFIQDEMVSRWRMRFSVPGAISECSFARLHIINFSSHTFQFQLPPPFLRCGSAGES